MKNYKVYGNEKTHLELSEKAYKAYSSYDPIEIREYEYDAEDENGDIITDEAGDAVKTYAYDITGAFEEHFLTEDDVNELFEEDYDNSHRFDLRIHYKNGETDDYINRLAGHLWETDGEANDVISEMIDGEWGDDIRDISENENIKFVDIVDSHGNLMERYDRDDLMEFLGE